MTVEEVQRAIEEIRAMRSDPVMARESEDALRARVLAAIAAGAPNAAELAAAVLETTDVDFPRGATGTG